MQRKLSAAPMIDPEDDDSADMRRMAEANADKSRKPSNHPFKQQALKAWKPVLSPSNVVPTFFGVGALFAVIGGALLGVTNEAAEFTVEYTRCTALDSGGGSTGQSCADLIAADGSYRSPETPWNRCQCDVEFSLSGFKGKDTYLYYALTNYYQNQRRYANSRDDLQLRSLETEPSDDCDPLTQSPDGRPYAPCGLIANSLFNDTVQLFDAAGAVVQLRGDGIAWSTDVNVKFANPTIPSGGTLCDATGLDNSTAPPPNWWQPACELGADNVSALCDASTQNNSATGCSYAPWSPFFGSSGLGYQNEDFIVWMRTATLPKFKKLWRRIPGGLPDGVYRARIGYNYPVISFAGTKSLQFGTTTGLGGKSTFLPGVFLAFGLLMLTAGIVFVAMWKSSFYGIRVADTRSVQINTVIGNSAYAME